MRKGSISRRGFIYGSFRHGKFHHSTEKFRMVRMGALGFRLSLESGKELSDDIIVMLHFPPDFAVMEVIEEFDTKMCIYGHLHTAGGFMKALDNENYFLVSADYLAFEPKKLV